MSRFLQPLSILMLISRSSAGFVHPGLLHTQSDFNRMAQKVAAKASPWIDSYNILTSNWETSLSYTPSNQTYINRGSGCTPDNSAALWKDAAAAYQMALIWKITGNTSYADKAVQICNAWSSTLTGIGCQNGSSHDYILEAGIQGYQFANAAEILRNYSGWSASEFTAFKNMMINVFLPVNEQFPRPMSEYANWDLADMASIMAIGVLTDNTTLFNQIIDYFKTGSGNGAIGQAVYYVHPGYLGQGQEAGRDQGHATLDIAHLSVIAQQAWNQGIDLYGYQNNRVLAMAEYAAKLNLINSSAGNSTYYNLPFTAYAYSNWPTEIFYTNYSTSAQGTLRRTWACLYHHYANVRGVAAPYTGKMMDLAAPDGGGGNYGGNSGGYDQLGYQTLTCSQNPISSGAAPSGLTGVLRSGAVVLSWWGSQYATSYVVKRRNNTGGPYSVIASGIQDFTYTDAAPAGTYYYVVSANSSTGPQSNQAKVVANPQSLNTYLTFDSISGKVAIDSSGNGNNGTLQGNATIVAGKSGNAVKLDGSTGYVSLPANVVCNLSDFTIASWLYLSSTTSYQRLFDFGFGPGRWMSFSPIGNNGNASFFITLNTWGGLQSINGNKPIPTGVWNHVAITLYGTTGSYYVNGSLVTTNTDLELPPYQMCGAVDLVAQNWIGRSQYSGSDGNDPYLNGVVDDFRIYQGALTASQVSSLYSSG